MKVKGQSLALLLVRVVVSVNTISIPQAFTVVAFQPQPSRIISSSLPRHSTSSTSSISYHKHPRVSVSNTRLEAFPDPSILSNLLVPSISLPSLPNVANVANVATSINTFDLTTTLDSLTPEAIITTISKQVQEVSIPSLIQQYSKPLTAAFTTVSFLYILSKPNPNFRSGNDPYSRGKYDPIQARAYYSKRPLLVIRRLAQLFRLSNSFLFSLLFDKYILRDTERNIEQRATDLLELIQEIGPTAIKIGQALSARQDLIPEPYAVALAQLQDNVPPFPSEQARELLQQELGPKYNLLSNIDLTAPVASASIGQVYRGYANVLTDGVTQEVEVAVKVQRPDVLAEIALDLFIVREFSPIYAKIVGSSSDLQSLANEWGRGFIAELTYIDERKNTIKFNQEMQKMNLNAVVAPTVVDSLCTDRILTTEWVDGTRLDKSTEEDVARLCGVALNAYLVMLLETGVLHTDPHPGNLLRTKDGKLCILDFGMTLETPKDLQYSLLEFLAHLTAEDYEQVPKDLVNLDFLKAEKLDFVEKAGLLEPLYYFLKQANQGGGGSKVRERIIAEYREKYPGADDDELRKYIRKEINDQSEKMAEKASAVTGVTTTVEDLQRENKDSFAIPDWFLYTSRAFLILEGISLKVDPDYSLVQSCFPYVAKRLLADDSPRSEAALRALIYGDSDAEEINAEKITDLADGFQTYSTTTKIFSEKVQSASSKSDGSNIEATISLAKDSADILLAPDGNLIQKILVEESATALNAQIKDSLREVLLTNPERIRNSLPLGLGNLLPKGPVEQVGSFLRKSHKEEKVQELVEKLGSFAPELPMLSNDNNNGPPSPIELANAIRAISSDNESSASLIEGMSAEETTLLLDALRENVPKYGSRAVDLGGKVASTVLGKISDDIETVLTSTEESSDVAEQLVRNSAKGISAAAKGSSDFLNEQRATTSSSN